jgi:hypothetical protein
MIFLRPNYLPTYFIFFIFNIIVSVKKNNIMYIILFSIGFLLILIFPIHNFFFSDGQLILLTNSATIKENLIIHPSKYLQLFDTSNLRFIINHLFSLFTAGSLKLDIFIINIIVLFNLLYFLFFEQKKSLIFFSLIILSQFIPMLFYSSAIRYSYFPWFLVMVCNLMIINDFFNKKFKNH